MLIKYLFIFSAIIYTSQFEFLLERYRAINGMHPLIETHQLDKCAQKRAAIVYTTEFSHDGWQDDYCGAGIRGENLARNYDSNTEALRAWIESPAHNENLLQDKYRTFGVGKFKNIRVLLFN
jgi:uncharacterized protein YkwD